MKHFFKSKRTKITFAIWAMLCVLVCAMYAILTLMSSGRLDSAKMRVVSQEIATYEQIQACANNNQALCNDVFYSYRIKLLFASHIFRAQRYFSQITPYSVAWDAGVEHLELSSIIQNSKDDNYIWLTTTQKIELGEEIGTLAYSTQFYPRLMLEPLAWLVIILVVAIWFRWLLLLYREINTSQPTFIQANISLSYKDRIFFVCSILIILLLFGFQAWLGFPGFHIIGDTYNSIGLIKDNWHPVFIAYCLEWLYALFGKHLYYLFFFNLIPFYAGLIFLVCGFYIHFKSVFALTPVLIVAVGNIYFQNFIQYHSFALPMLLFCGYAMVLYAILVPPKHKVAWTILWIFIAIVFCIALLWRHNAIFSVFPVSFVVVYLYLTRKSLSTPPRPPICKSLYKWRYYISLDSFKHRTFYS